MARGNPTDIIEGGGTPTPEFQTLFDDRVVPTPSNTGDWGGSVNGDTTFGQGGAPKGVAGIMPEVTYVEVAGAPAPGGQATLEDIAGAPKPNLGK